MSENPMLRPMTTDECIDYMPESEIDELPICEMCGRPVYEKYKGANAHKQCYAVLRAEAMGEI